jgi:hypothetical protein
MLLLLFLLIYKQLIIITKWTGSHTYIITPLGFSIQTFSIYTSWEMSESCASISWRRKVDVKRDSSAALCCFIESRVRIYPISSMAAVFVSETDGLILVTGMSLIIDARVCKLKRQTFDDGRPDAQKSVCFAHDTADIIHSITHFKSKIDNNNN